VKRITNFQIKAIAQSQSHPYKLQNLEESAKRIRDLLAAMIMAPLHGINPVQEKYSMIKKQINEVNIIQSRKHNIKS
jgi:hypothetical protein